MYSVLDKKIIEYKNVFLQHFSNHNVEVIEFTFRCIQVASEKNVSFSNLYLYQM